MQTDSGTIDTVAPRRVAKMFAMKEKVMPNKDIGFIAASGSKIESGEPWATVQGSA